mgnify:CR=1 FL=1
MPSPAIPEPKDEEVREAGFWVGDITEGKGLVYFLAVLVPEVDDLGFGLSGLGSCGLVALDERSAVIRLEEISGGRCSKRHALDCG